VVNTACLSTPPGCQRCPLAHVEQASSLPFSSCRGIERILTEHSGGSAARCAERLCLSGGLPLLLLLAAMPLRSAQRTSPRSGGLTLPQPFKGWGSAPPAVLVA